MARFSSSFLVYAAAVLILATAQGATGLIHKLHISNDNRRVFNIETFGFSRAGVARLTVNTFGMSPMPAKGPEGKVLAGFVIQKVNNKGMAMETVERVESQGSCLLKGTHSNESSTSAEKSGDQHQLLDVEWLAGSDSKSWSKGWTHTHKIGEAEAGLYQVVFNRCLPADVATTVSFSIEMEFYNVHPDGTKDYLSAGESSTPGIYFFFSLIFLGLTAVWIYICRQEAEHTHHIHILMAMLVLLKAGSVFFHGLSYSYEKAYGVTAGWTAIYYIFAFLKGIMFFMVILLMGTGWSLIKPHLNEREKRIFMLVLPLQIVDNIALVVFEEMSPGSVAWLSWRDVLHLIDILCCCLILFPIVWSIKHLRETAEGGRKESQLQKLMQYRNFYVSVVSYIYFTRIIVLIIGTALSYEVTWMKPFCEELAGVVFFAYTGSKFKPMDNNPYLRVDLGEDDDGGDDDDELHGGEFGLRDGAESDDGLDDADGDGVELPTRGKRTKMVGGEEEP